MPYLMQLEENLAFLADPFLREAWRELNRFLLKES